jgi:hypothetical protein
MHCVLIVRLLQLLAAEAQSWLRLQQRAVAEEGVMVQHASLPCQHAVTMCMHAGAGRGGGVSSTVDREHTVHSHWSYWDTSEGEQASSQEEELVHAANGW